jgi:hypothetical protein
MQNSNDFELGDFVFKENVWLMDPMKENGFSSLFMCIPSF